MKLLGLSNFPASLAKRSSIVPNNTCTDIIPYGPTWSTVGLGMFTRTVSALVQFPGPVISQLVGHLLGDGFLVLRGNSTNPFFRWDQTVHRFGYSWHVFVNLCHYCNTIMKLGFIFLKSTGKIYGKYSIVTRSYSGLLSLYQLFYREENGKFVKYISEQLFIYLDPIALAYWAMDDGSNHHGTFMFATHGFTVPEVYRLAGILHYNFGIDTTVKFHKGVQPMLYVDKSSSARFVAIVKPHFHHSMLYKIANL